MNKAMKYKNLILYVFLIIAVYLPQEISAQPPKNVVEPYWIIKGNVKNPKNNIIYFYNAEHQLMYKEIIEGRKINIKNPNVRQQLNAALADILTAQKQEKLLADEILIVRNRLQKNKHLNPIQH